MKSVFFAAVLSAALVIPTVSFAQTAAPASPVPVQAGAGNGPSAVGGVADGSSANGPGAQQPAGSRIAGFFHRGNIKGSPQRDDCVGPTSFCDIYSGS